MYSEYDIHNHKRLNEIGFFITNRNKMGGICSIRKPTSIEEIPNKLIIMLTEKELLKTKKLIDEILKKYSED